MIEEASRLVSRIELDINTAEGDGMEFTSEQMSGIFQKLVCLGTEILEKGDK